MFESELAKLGIKARYHLEASYIRLGIERVRLDLSRMLQALINLLTNAFKCTQTQAARQIIVTTKTDVERPSSDDSGVQYIRSNRSWIDSMVNGNDQAAIYITVEVSDTGRGLSTQEDYLLSQCFSQASAETHVEYGGSRLGLFVSCQLTELLGGEIGIPSGASLESTSAFHCKALR